MISALFEANLFKNKNTVREAIQNPNSSGQGFDETHQLHALHATAVQHGFKYSHSTPIRQHDGIIATHHTWAHGEHKIEAYHGSEHWNSKVSSASGHETIGHGAQALAKHLKGKAKRYKMIEDAEEFEHDDEDLELVTEIITNFSLALTNEDDLSEAFEDLCSYYDLDDEDASLLAYILIEASMDESDNDDDASDDAIEKNVRSFLKFLSQPFPKATSTSPNREGLTPLANERGVKKFLATLTVSKNPDPYGNDDAFSAKDVAVYDREKNHHGHPNVDFDNQKPSRPLAAATRDVSTGNQQFESYQLPNVKIQEGLLRPLNPKYLESIDRAFTQIKTMSGDMCESGAAEPHAQNWRETRELINKQKAKSAPDISEFNELQEPRGHSKRFK
jgi:hypothetical protein